MSLLAALAFIFALGWGYQQAERMKDAIEMLLAPWRLMWGIGKGGWQLGKAVKRKWKAFWRKPTYGDSRFAGWDELKGERGFAIGRLGKGVVRLHHESCALMFGARGAA